MNSLSHILSKKKKPWLFISLRVAVKLYFILFVNHLRSGNMHTIGFRQYNYRCCRTKKTKLWKCEVAGTKKSNKICFVNSFTLTIIIKKKYIKWSVNGTKTLTLRPPIHNLHTGWFLAGPKRRAGRTYFAYTYRFSVYPLEWINFYTHKNRIREGLPFAPLSPPKNRQCRGYNEISKPHNHHKLCKHYTSIKPNLWPLISIHNSFSLVAQKMYKQIYDKS